MISHPQMTQMTQMTWFYFYSHHCQKYSLLPHVEGKGWGPFPPSPSIEGDCELAQQSGSLSNGGLAGGTINGNVRHNHRIRHRGRHNLHRNYRIRIRIRRW